MVRHWNLILIVLFAAVLLFFVSEVVVFSPGHAQAQTDFSVSGNLSVIPVQLGRENYGIAMIDQTAQTIWLYRINRSPSHKKLELIAARSWKYDKMLQNFNSSDPSPQQVKMLLQGIKTDESGKNEPNAPDKK
jgi:hypothetical protein